VSVLAAIKVEMSESIVGAPRIPSGLLVRERLSAAIGATALTVVRGPGGSGKTVLMAQWLPAANGARAWLTVDQESGDPDRFWRAAAEGLVRAGVTLDLATTPDSSGTEIRRALARALRERDDRVTLVIDDAHKLTNPAILDDLLDLLRASPAIAVVVGTRTRTPLEAASQALTLDVTIIGPDDLQLTEIEIETIVGDAGLRRGSAADLHQASGGNPLLLRAILAGTAGDTGSSASAAMIVRDLLNGLFTRRGAAVGAFASATAVPDDLDTALAATLSGVDVGAVAPLLASLESEGLLTRSETGGGPRYRYPPLVREVLRSELRRTQPDRFRSLSLLASAAAETAGDYLAALRHATESGDYARASDVCLHGGMTLLRSPGAAAILQQVPARYVARLPFIAIVLGLAANVRGERWKALELLTLALGASRASRSRQRVAERVGLALVESVVLRITGQATESMAAARRMVTLLEQAPAVELEEIASQVDSFRLQAALSLFRGGALSEALVTAERAGSSAHALESGRPEALGAASVVAAVQAIRGEVRTAATNLARIDASDYPIEQRDGYVGSLAHFARAIVALEDVDPERAEREVDVLRELVNIEHLMLFAVLRSLVWLWRGQPQVGLRLLEERDGTDRPRKRMSREDRQALAFGRVLLHAGLGQHGAAHDVLRTLERGDPLRAVLEAAILLLEQRPELVADRLGRVSELPGPRLQAIADLLSADAAVLLGDGAVAEAAMRRFLGIATVHGVSTPFVLIPVEHRAALLALAEQIGADDEVISSLASLPAPIRSTGARAVLTPRESDVLAALRTDASQARIASDLGVSANTVKSQIRTLYRKLGASNREGALREAYLQGLLDPSPERGE
jgi:LuxR family maltose regulon positive regulatory protein